MCHILLGLTHQYSPAKSTNIVVPSLMNAHECGLCTTVHFVLISLMHLLRVNSGALPINGSPLQQIPFNGLYVWVSQRLNKCLTTPPLSPLELFVPFPLFPVFDSFLPFVFQNTKRVMFYYNSVSEAYFKLPPPPLNYSDIISVSYRERETKEGKRKQQERGKKHTTIRTVFNSHVPCLLMSVYI